MLALQLNEQKDSYSPGRKEAELLTFTTFKDAVLQALQKLKGNVNSLDISACTSLERERERERERETVVTGSQAPTLCPLQRCSERTYATNIAIAQRSWRCWTDQSYSRHVVQWGSGGQNIPTLLVSLLRLTSWRANYRAQSCSLFTGLRIHWGNWSVWIVKEFCQTKHRKPDMHTFQKVWANLQTLQSCMPNQCALLWLKNKRLFSS